MPTIEGTRTRRALRSPDKRTASFHLSVSSLEAIDQLVEREVFANKSHAVDEALKLLIAEHRAELDAPEARVA